ncbi:MAG: ABC transporter ATP-binding protein, partial [Acidimicrobiia bacterium]|nr:ABC transporter ATP-binding protein [Acidimicrobiia bacterium]
MSKPLLEVNDLRTYFTTEEGVVRAVDGISFTINEGERFGV